MANTFSTDLEASSSQGWSISDGSQSGLDLSTALTFSLWIKLESAPAVQANMVTKSSSSNESYFFAYRTASTPNLRLSVDQLGTGVTQDILGINTTLSTGVWYHLAVTWLGSTKTAKFYINGSQSGSDQVGTLVSSIFNGSAPFEIGQFASAGLYFDGLINDVRVWSRVLSSTEIGDLYANGCTFNNGANIVSKWFTTNNGNDEIGNNNLTNNNSATFSSDVPYTCPSNSNFFLVM